MSMIKQQAAVLTHHQWAQVRSLPALFLHSAIIICVCTSKARWSADRHELTDALEACARPLTYAGLAGWHANTDLDRHGGRPV